jgi:transcriptional regulator with XRE-family HTH domain
MLDRIKQILEEKGLRANSFAAKIQVSPGTISHILNGRNGPRRETLEKILEVFPDISQTWLYRGEGPMYNRERLFDKIASTSTPIQQDLFDEKRAIDSSGKSQFHEDAQKNEVKKPKITTDTAIIQDINLSKNLTKKIDRIMIFFSDKTFMTFISED